MLVESATTPSSADLQRDSELLARYRQVRRFSDRIAEPLSAEDCAIQSMPDVSPTRWHLAHTTWFFETFLLQPLAGHRPFHHDFEHLFNSYYNAVGKQFPRAERGQLSRPGLETVWHYRRHVDEVVEQLLESHTLSPQQQHVMEIGLQHEQQHQELMLTDIKHVLASNPLHPVYETAAREPSAPAAPLAWIPYEETLTHIGAGGEAFAYDNEQPRHRVFLEAFQLASRTVTNGEFLEFIEAGGYERPEFWLSLGWQAVQDSQWQAPLYWKQLGGEWHEYTLAGLVPLDLHAPVCHVSYFETDAYARWAGFRLPTEFEWEHAIHAAAPPAQHSPARLSQGHFADRLLQAGRAVHPVAEKGDDAIAQFTNAIGNQWEWTRSQYSPYPGYQPPPGALGEYNGKFMCNQFVLRGGSCATPCDHLRITYRNFFPPEARWQFTGIRLAADDFLVHASS